MINRVVPPLSAAVSEMPLSWSRDVREVLYSAQKGSAAQTLAATPAECAAIARLLDLRACHDLTATLQIAPTHGDRFHMTGSFKARISQLCVVTLEPLETAIEQDIRCDFWPAEQIRARAGDDDDHDEAEGNDDEPEPIVDGVIATGRIIYEMLAIAIDPFPRKPDASLDWHDQAGASSDDGGSTKPFAALSKLKPKS